MRGRSGIPPGSCRWGGPIAWRWIALVVLATPFAGCGDDGPVEGPGPIGPIGPVGAAVDDDAVVGSGEIVAESRDVEGFDRVVLAGEGAATIVFGAQENLTIEADDNLLSLIEASVVDGALEIRSADGNDIDPSESITYRITTTALASVELSGAGSIDVEDWVAETSRVVLSGAGDVRIPSLEAEVLDVAHLGVGSIIIGGSVDTQNITTSGVGAYDALELESAFATVESGGASDANLWVTTSLAVTASDTASVSYYGSPEVTQQLEGLASITSLGERQDGSPTPDNSPTPTVEEVRFTSGRYQLVGDLTLPGGDGPHPAVIVVHGDGDQTRTSTPGTQMVLDRFGAAGFAVLAWDKPGSGESTGEFDQGETLRQRAAILVDGVELLGDHPAIDSTRIGLWGLSQAGWVMPMALERTDAVAFMITVSGGGEDSIEQLGYQLGQRVVCEGRSPAEGELVADLFPQAAKGPTYDRYAEAMEVLVEIEGWETFVGPDVRPEESWQPWPTEIDAYFDPMTVIGQTTIPVLAIFGEMDRFIDPVQGADAYERALLEAQNPNYQVELIPGVGHTMLEQSTMCGSGGTTSERYLELLDQWIDMLATMG